MFISGKGIHGSWTLKFNIANNLEDLNNDHTFNAETPPLIEFTLTQKWTSREIKNIIQTTKHTTEIFFYNTRKEGISWLVCWPGFESPIFHQPGQITPSVELFRAPTSSPSRSLIFEKWVLSTGLPTWQIVILVIARSCVGREKKGIRWSTRGENQEGNGVDFFLSGKKGKWNSGEFDFFQYFEYCISLSPSPFSIIIFLILTIVYYVFKKRCMIDPRVKMSPFIFEEIR